LKNKRSPAFAGLFLFSKFKAQSSNFKDQSKKFKGGIACEPSAQSIKHKE
jgi:hypothetical protein